MKIKSTILFSLIFTAQLLLGLNEQPQLSERLFQSDIFTFYRQQYQESVAPLSPQLQIDKEDHRAFYTDFLSLLRSKENIPTEAYRWFFLGTDVSDKQIEEAKQHLDLSQLTENEYSDPKKIADIIDKSFQTTLNLEGYTGTFEKCEIYLDPILAGNFPYVLDTLHIASKEIQLIKMPVPAHPEPPITDKKDINQVKIDEEFKTFLISQAAAGKKHLYINFMKESKPSEQPFYHEIVALEELPQLANRFSFASFDKDTDFYYQRGIFAELNDSKQFINLFLERLASNSDGFRWPPNLDQQAWHARYTKIVHELYTNLFGVQPTLNVQERQAIIDIAYSRIISALLEEIQPDTCNLTCFRTVDRAATALAIFLFDRDYTENKQISNRLALNLISLIVNQPLLLQNRQGHSYRIERVSNALRYFN